GGGGGGGGGGGSGWLLRALETGGREALRHVCPPWLIAKRAAAEDVSRPRAPGRLRGLVRGYLPWPPRVHPRQRPQSLPAPRRVGRLRRDPGRLQERGRRRGVQRRGERVRHLAGRPGVRDRACRLAGPNDRAAR